MVLNARLEWGPAWLVSIAWLAGSRTVNNCARHLVWITFAALCCQPRVVGPSLGNTARRGGEVPFVRSCPGWWVPAIGTERACCLVGCLDGRWGLGGIGEKLLDTCCECLQLPAKVGRVSAQDAQYVICCWCGGCGRLQAQATLSKWYVGCGQSCEGKKLHILRNFKFQKQIGAEINTSICANNAAYM